MKRKLPRVEVARMAMHQAFDACLLAGALAFLVTVANVFAAQAAEPARTGEDAAVQQATAWFDAARSGDVAILRGMLDRGVPTDRRDERGSTALILAAYYGRLDAVDILLDAGADPNVGDAARGNTALMGALFRGEDAVAMRLLADPRTDANVRNGAGQTAAMYAGLFGRASMIEALRARGADFGAADARGSTAASLARQQGSDALADRIAALAASGDGSPSQ